MSELVNDAITVLRELPDDVQEATARAILAYSGGTDPDLQLSDDQVAEIERRIDNPHRAYFTPDQTRDRLRRFGV